MVAEQQVEAGDRSLCVAGDNGQEVEKEEEPRSRKTP